MIENKQVEGQSNEIRSFLKTEKNSFLYDDCLFTNTIIVAQTSGVVISVH